MCMAQKTVQDNELQVMTVTPMQKGKRGLRLMCRCTGLAMAGLHNGQQSLSSLAWKSSGLKPCILTDGQNLSIMVFLSALSFQPG